MVQPRSLPLYTWLTHKYNTSVMTTVQVLVILATTLELAWSQAYNGFINPVFLPSGLREGFRRSRLYDPYSENRGLDFRFDDYRRYPNQYPDYRYSGDRRANGVYNLYPEDLRYQTNGIRVRGQILDRGQFLDREQLLNGGQFLDRGQTLNGGQFLDRGQTLNGGQFLDRGQALNGGQFLDRGQTLNGGQFLDRGDILDRGQFLNAGSSLGRGQILERGQILNGGQVLSTSTPELSVTVQPNGSS